MENEQLRDSIAIEAMKIFLNHQGIKLTKPINRIKIFLGIKGYKRVYDYSFNDIASKSYELADIMIKTKNQQTNT